MINNFDHQNDPNESTVNNSKKQDGTNAELFEYPAWIHIMSIRVLSCE